MAVTTSRDTQRKYLASGKCIQCGKRKPVSATLCRPCLSAHNQATKAQIARNLEAGRCRQCGRGPLATAALCEACRIKHNACAAAYKARKRREAQRSVRR